MDSTRCPKCGKLLTQESRDSCQCPDRPDGSPVKGFDGRLFVKILLLGAAVITVLAIIILYLIVKLRIQYGLSGWHS